MDADGELQNGFENAEWLHKNINALPPAARWDLKDALKWINEFNCSVRILRIIEQNHGTSTVGIQRRLP